MPLRVKSMEQYLTEAVQEMRPKDYTALQIVKAVKGRDPGGFQKQVKYKNILYAFGPGNPEGAVNLWTEWCANILRSAIEYENEPLAIVPVPNSNAIAGDTSGFRTFELAQRIAAQMGGNVIAIDELRWSEKMKPASTGGTRLAYDLYPRLIFEKKAPIEVERVLIDDVLTSGGHLQASSAKLRENGINLQAALSCGRTTHVQITDPFNVPIEELPDFDPKDPFGFNAISAFLTD